MTGLRPALDDVTYGDLVAHALGRLPAVGPNWTDHNPSDPGIVLVELLAWLAETLVYRADQLPDSRYDAFLSLLNGPGWTRTGSLDDAVTATLAQLRTPYRAVTEADLEDLVLRQWPASAAAGALAAGPTAAAIARVVTLADTDGDGDARTSSPGHLSVVVVPARADQAAEPPAPSAELTAALWRWLEPRRLLGVRHHVVGPRYVPVRVGARLVLRDQYAPERTARSGVLTDAAIAIAAAEDAATVLRGYLDPLRGGREGHGWPFGRNLHLSELYEVLDRAPGVDYADEVHFVGLPPGRAIEVDGAVVAARLDADELPAVVVTTAGDADSVVAVLPTGGGA